MLNCIRNLPNLLELSAKIETERDRYTNEQLNTPYIHHAYINSHPTSDFENQENYKLSIELQKSSLVDSIQIKPFTLNTNSTLVSQQLSDKSFAFY